MPKELNWAVLGTGVIANQMAAGLQKMGKSLYAVGNRTHSKAVAFAEKYGIKKVYGTIDEMFYDDNVDITERSMRCSTTTMSILSTSQVPTIHIMGS